MGPTPEPVTRIAGFRHALLTWYEQNRRPLPWRKNTDPYQVWVSEIMLQQTRVAAVLVHYERFMRRFPTLEKLASARETTVLAEWSGLGYYRRARHLHAAARLLVNQHRGRLPETAQDWLSLPGIGRYTAAAIASITSNEAVAALDGNVERVLRRLLATPQTAGQLWHAAQELLDSSRPGDFNQAMMELGATVCLPSQPGCHECPVRSFCRSRGPGEPVKRKHRQHKREVAYALAQSADRVLLVCRDKGDRLMPAMWELPEVTTPDPSDKRLFSLRHAITVTDFRVHVVRRRVPGGGTWISVTRLRSLPLTGLTKKILRMAEIID